VTRTLDTFGGLDVAVNSAGVFSFTGPTAECSEEDWDRIVGVNLRGVWLSMKHQIPAMVARGSGSIVNVAGAFGLIGFPGIPAYVAAKHGVVGLTKAAALEYVSAGLRINAICPGVTHTPMIEAATGGDPQAQAQFAAQMPINRMADPDEVAEAIVWMSASDFLVGHAMSFDGGWVVQ
jgi:NAD(P)-dependent dehydrogenase (short-subunit alcohol dehydrogenase family)